MEEMRNDTDRMRLELRQEFLSQQVCVESIQPLVSPAPKSIKRICVAPTTPGKDIIGQTRECELLVVGNMLPQVVAIG